MGRRACIGQQLHPQTINDSALEQRVAQLDLVRMSSRDLWKIYLADDARFLQRQKEQAQAEIRAPFSASFSG